MLVQNTMIQYHIYLTPTCSRKCKTTIMIIAPWLVSYNISDKTLGYSFKNLSPFVWHYLFLQRQTQIQPLTFTFYMTFVHNLITLFYMDKIMHWNISSKNEDLQLTIAKIWLFQQYLEFSSNHQRLKSILSCKLVTCYATQTSDIHTWPYVRD